MTQNPSTLCRKYHSEVQIPKLNRGQTPHQGTLSDGDAMKTIRGFLKQESRVRQLERRPTPHRPGRTISPLLVERATQMEQIDSLFKTVPAAHRDQVGLFILVDRLLQKEEVRRSLHEGTLITTAPTKQAFVTSPQKLLQKINRLLCDSDHLAMRIRVRAPRNHSPHRFVAGIVGLCERILRFPLRHHHSVVEAAKELVDGYGTLRAVVTDYLENCCKAAKSGTKGFNAEQAIHHMERSDELLGAYVDLSYYWKRFTYLLFKERAYNLIQVDETEIETLMETTSRLTA